ncbi:MAG: hypothetical protein OEZ38_14070 [Gammaproteobacteria bacterium]|nr:hypothetical protein [Gammaproteobacteria bacterium]
MILNFKKLWHIITVITIAMALISMYLKDKGQSEFLAELHTPFLVLVTICGLLMVPGLLELKVKLEDGKLTFWREKGPLK